MGQACSTRARRPPPHRVARRGGIGEIGSDRCLDRRQEGRGGTGHVADQDRLVVQAKLPPGDDLDRLVERAETAGQRNEGIGGLEHALLAGVHGSGDDKFGDARMRNLPPRQEFRDDADHLAAGGQGGIGHDAHQPDASAAIDQPDAGFRQSLPERLRSRSVCGIVSGTRATEDGNGINLGHGRACGQATCRFATAFRLAREFWWRTAASYRSGGMASRNGGRNDMMRKFALLAVLAIAAVGAAKAQGAYDPIETRQAGQALLSGDFAGIRAVVAAKGDVKTLENPSKSMARWIRQFPTSSPRGASRVTTPRRCRRSGPTSPGSRRPRQRSGGRRRQARRTRQGGRHRCSGRRRSRSWATPARPATRPTAHVDRRPIPSPGSRERGGEEFSRPHQPARRGAGVLAVLEHRRA